MKKRWLNVFLAVMIVVGLLSALGTPAIAARWYDNLNYQKTDNAVENMVRIMESQVGKTGADLGYTTDWCAIFVWDCASLANMPGIQSVTGTSRTLASNLFGALYHLDGYTGALFNDPAKYNSLWDDSYSKSEYQWVNASSYIPQRGDFLFILNDGYRYISHVAVVTGVDGQWVDVVQGNWGTLGVSGNKVRTDYSFKRDGSGPDSGRVCGYVRCVDVTSSTAGIVSDINHPSAPSRVSVEWENQSAMRARVSWDSVPEATSYEVEYNHGNDAWKTENDYRSGTSFISTGVGHTNYFYRVRSVNSVGKSDWTTGTFTASMATTSTPVPSAPKKVTVVWENQAAMQAKVSWDSVSGATSYEVEYNHGNDAWRTESDYRSGTSFISTGVGHTSYFYRVRAVNDGNKSDWTIGTFASAPTPTPTPAPTPTPTPNPTSAPAPLPTAKAGDSGSAVALSATANSDCSITLSWNNSGWAGYWVRRATNSDGPWTGVAELSGTTTSWTDRNLPASTRYYYYVQPFNTAGQGRDHSNTITCITTAAPAPIPTPTPAPSPSPTPTAAPAPATDRDDPHFEKQTLYFQGQFNDVPADQWFTKSVSEAYELGLMKGGENSTFNPYGDVTLAEAITMACRIRSIYEIGTESFVQSGDKWYQVYLDYAYQVGIISRAYYNANVENKATRAQFAEIFANALPDKALYPVNTIDDNAIPDVSMSESYAPYAYKLYRAGILTGGDANGTFSPGTYITRAEAAAIVSRMAESNNRVTFSLR